MLKETKKIVWFGGIALLVILIISVFTFAPKKEKAAEVNIAVDKNTNIVTDGEYIFFNNSDGDVMTMHAFDTTAEIWVEDRKVLSVSNDNIVLKNKEGLVEVFSREEKGIEETYDIDSDTIYCTSGAIYYVDNETRCIMQIDRKTKEEVRFLDTAVNDMLIFGNRLIIAPEEKGKGIVVFDYDSGNAMQFALEKTVEKLAFADHMVVYADTKDVVRKLNLNSGSEVVVKNVETDGLCFSKGVYFYVDRVWGKYKLGINDTDAFR